MTHWKLTLSYDGTTFRGWQVQPDHPTIQGTLASAIGHVTGEVVLPQGSGRTDAGVHALEQVASFDLVVPIPPDNLLRALNRALPQSIRVLTAEIVSENFHARHSTRSKTYEYRIFERRPQTSSQEARKERICSPFLAPYVWDCRWPLSLETMQQAAAFIFGTHDFTSFAACDPEITLRESDGTSPTMNPVKTVHASSFERFGDLLTYRVHGSGFLHHMVRNLVGTFVDVGRGALQPDSIPKILAARDRSQAGPTAPAQGLFLVKVDYKMSETQL
jgi:tRNA pseudouridine38-40 synthase